VKRSMKGKPKGVDLDYDARQLKLKEDKKEGVVPQKGPSEKILRKRPRRHKPKAASTEELSERNKTDFDAEEGAADEDEAAKRIKRIQKKLEGDKELVPTISAPKQRQQQESQQPASTAWKDILKEKLEEMEESKAKEQLGRLLSFNNVPMRLKPQKFKNFVKESLALFSAEMAPVIDEMWEVFVEVVKNTK